MKSKTIIFLSILIVILSIVSYSIYRVYTNHFNRRVDVVEKRIIEAGELCFNEDKCAGNVVTLNELISKGYIGKEINPKTKTYYNESSYVLKKENNYTFVEV